MLRFVAPAAALAIVAVIVMASGRLPASAQTGPTVSVDAVPSAGNSATTVGTINTSRFTTCTTFNVDVVIQGVTNIAGIAGFQADLLYDPAILRVIGVDYNYLLTTGVVATIPPTSTAVLNVGNPTPDSDGNFRLAAAMFASTPFTGANGNGVLARITLQAVGSGSSPLDLTKVKLSEVVWVNNPTPPPPLISIASLIGPIDTILGSPNFGFYSGPVNDALIDVDPPCSVGGIAELPDIVGTPLEAGDSSGANAGFPAAAAAAAGVGALAVGSAAWYARKRWLR